MTRRGFSLEIIIIIVIGIIALFTTIILPVLTRAKELSHKAAAVELENIMAVATPLEPPTVEEMEETAEEYAEEHDICNRVVALTENLPNRQLTIRIPGKLAIDSSGLTEVMLLSDDNLGAVRVQINGRVVYEQVDGEIQTYLGMGEWEQMLGDIERKFAGEREERFRAERERRFGPLPGWGG